MRKLSGGMKRRVLVAQALVHKPPVIVLDEPTAGVDVELRQGLWQFIQRLNRDGHTVVLTTHYLEEAETLCGRIAMLKAGRVIALDSTPKLLNLIAGKQLSLTLSEGTIPDSLMPMVSSGSGSHYTLKFKDYAEIEQILAQLRAAGCGIDDMEIEQADLEDVFVSLMRDHKVVAQ
jgi:ABC-2 type transport system ATP-binding protein